MSPTGGGRPTAYAAEAETRGWNGFLSVATEGFNGNDESTESLQILLVNGIVGKFQMMMMLLI